jgi:signal transduction histidine kinase
MDESIRSSLFEPFFSTKGQGKGTGLGLVSVLALVHRSGGVMEVKSTPGQGSRFGMLFPPRSRPSTGGA